MKRHNDRMRWNDFYDRYDQALAESSASEAEVLRRAGYGPDKIRNSRRREVAPTDIVAIVHIARALGKSPFYLLETIGITPEILGVSLASARTADDIAKDDDERALLSAWRDITDEDRAALRVALRNAKIAADRAA